MLMLTQRSPCPHKTCIAPRTSGKFTVKSATRFSFQSPKVIFDHTRLGSSAFWSFLYPDVHFEEKTSPVGDVER